MSDKSLEQKNFTLNKALVALSIITILGGLSVWWSGYSGLPGDVQKLKSASEQMATIPTRVDQLEKAQAEMWRKRSEDHDLLLGISQSLRDLKEQSIETRQDVKDLHNKVIK